MNEKVALAGFMFDTNIFNKISDSQIDIDLFREFPLYITHVQRGELNKTLDTERRKKLMEIFKIIPSKRISTESTVFGISVFGECKFSDDSLYGKIKAELDKQKKEPNNMQDSLIAETAIKNNLILVTDDKCLRKIVRGLKGNAIELSQLIQRTKKVKE